MHDGIWRPKEYRVQAVFGRVSDLEFAYHDGCNMEFFFGAAFQPINRSNTRQGGVDHCHIV
jgi:hypothetical protein